MLSISARCAEGPRGEEGRAETQVGLQPWNNGRGHRTGPQARPGPRSQEVGPEPVCCGSVPEPWHGSPSPGQAPTFTAQPAQRGPGRRRDVLAGAALLPFTAAPMGHGGGATGPQQPSLLNVSLLPLTSCLVHGGPRLTCSPTPCGRAWHPPSLLIKVAPSFLETLVYERSFPYTSKQECIFPLFEVKANSLSWHSQMPPPPHHHHRPHSSQATPLPPPLPLLVYIPLPGRSQHPVVPNLGLCRVCTRQ